jgi:ribosomal protein S1
MGRLVENTSIKKKNPKDKIYCHDEDAQETYDKYCAFHSSGRIIAKDMLVGQVCRARISKIDGDKVIAQTESFQSVQLDYAREARFLQKKGMEALHPGMELEIMVDGEVRGIYTGSCEQAYIIGLKKDLSRAMKEKNSAYEVTIKSVNDGGFIVDLSGLDCFMPGSLAAANKIIDFSSMLGKKVYVMVETYLDQSDMFVVSNKRYIQHILPSKIKELNMSKEYTGTITGVMPYGCFVEWDEIFTGLLHETEAIDLNWKELKPGAVISFWIKEIKENNRVILSQKGPSAESAVFQAFKDKYEGEIFPDATVKDIKAFGVFIEMKTVVGMLTPREFKRTGVKAKEGEYLDVLVKQVDVQSKKIYLKAAVDTE